MSSLFSPARLSPQLRQPSTTRAMMLDVMVALLPALGMAVFFFGPRALTLTGTAVVSCVLFEGLYRLLTRQSQTIGDLSACVTGMLLALSLPVSSPYWVAVLGSGFAIVVVKQFYGGMGRNFMNPALAGRMLAATLPTLMTTWPEPLRWLALSQEVDVVSTATPMAQLHEGLLPAQGLDQLFLGLRGGCMGEVSAFMLLLGGLYLFLRRVISLRVPGSYLGTVALLSLLLCPDGAEPLRWAACQLLGGGLLLGAFFFAVDPATTPVTPRGQTMFGVGCGLFTVLLRTCSSYPEGVGWAILTMNCMVWLLDRLGMPRRFGMGPFATTRAWALNLRVSMAQIKFVPPKLPRRPARKEGGAPGEGFLDLLRTEGKVLAPLGAVLAKVMPAAVFSSETPFRASGALSVTEGYTSEGELVGYCVEVQSSGFSGLITMIVGVDTNGEVTGVAVTSHSETTTVGGWAMTPEALGRYVGRSGTIRSTGPNALDAVSGATATSKAITAGVNRALAIVATLDTEQEINYEDIE